MFINSANWKDLKIISNYCRITNNHLLYEKMLVKYSSFSENFSKKQFIGKGFGEFSTNAYRKVKLNNQDLFEKVLKNNSIDSKSVDYIFSNFDIISYVIKPFKMPRIIKVIDFSYLKIVYYEYLNLNSETINPNEIYKLLKRIYKNIEVSPDFESDLLCNQVFREGLDLLIFKYRNDKQSILSKMNLVENVFAHGDLNMNNINSFVLLDWDRCGFYPKGYDLAYYLIEMNSDSIYDIDKSFKLAKDIYDDSSKDFENVFIIYTVIFYLRVKRYNGCIIDEKIVRNLISKTGFFSKYSKTEE